MATAQQDADLLAALLLGDVGRLCDVLVERGGAELGTWPQPLPLYHAACIGGSAEAVAVLAAAGAPVDLAECAGLSLAPDVLDRLTLQLGDRQASILQKAAKGRHSAAALAAGSGRRDFLAALLEAGGLPRIGDSCDLLAQAAVAAACSARPKFAAADAAAAIATLEFLLGNGAQQDGCVQAAVKMYWELGQRDTARGVSRWLLQQSRRQGRFLELRAIPLCSVLAVAAAEGDIGQLRHFAEQLVGLPRGRSWKASAGTEVLLAAVFAPDPAVLQLVLAELVSGGSISRSSGTSGSTGGSASGNNTSPGWQLLQMEAEGALHCAACAAAKYGRLAALQLIILAGQPITTRLINTAAGLTDLRMLRWLLAAGPLPAPEVHGVHLHLYRPSWTMKRNDWYQQCPIWHAIRTVSSCLPCHSIGAVGRSGWQRPVLRCVEWVGAAVQVACEPSLSGVQPGFCVRALVLGAKCCHRYRQMWILTAPGVWIGMRQKLWRHWQMLATARQCSHRCAACAFACARSRAFFFLVKWRLQLRRVGLNPLL